MNLIEKQPFNIINDLDAVSYLNLFIKESFRLSLIDSSQLEKIQYQIVDLLTRLLHRYTSGQSSSVPVETGQKIQQSLLFTIGYYLKSLPDEETSLKMLIEKPLPDLYENGKNLIEKDFQKAKVQLQFIQDNCLSTDVYAYNDTIEGLSIFFSSYDMDYGAHETPCSVDYPLSNDKMNLTGIDYISEYLHKLELENKFCNYFSDEEIHSLMRGYDLHYKDLLFNIYELVLTNAIGSLLLGKDKINLHLKDYDRQQLQNELSDLSKIELDDWVDQAVSKLCRILMIENAELEKHLKRSTLNLKSRLKNALEIKELKHLFLSTQEEPSHSAIQFQDESKLDHEDFRALADSIRECRLVSDKITIIEQQPLSMTDLIDLLEGDCFFEKEYITVFQSLKEIQLALLVKSLPLDPFDFSFQVDESNKDWLCYLNTFLNQIEPNRKSSILKAADCIEIDQSVN